MKTIIFTLSTLLLASAAFAAAPVAPPLKDQVQTMDCGTLKDRRGTQSKSAPYLTVVSVNEKGNTQNYVKMVSLKGAAYEKLAMVSVNQGAAVQESKSYRLLIILKPRKIVISSKAFPDFTAVCKASNRL